MNGEPWSSLFNTVTEIVRRPPEAVWTLFLDRARWMDAFVSRELVGGTEGEEGALALVRMRVEGSPLRTEETLHVALHRRLVVRISVEGSRAGAHADFQFDPDPAGCRLQVSIHTWLGEGATPAQRAAAHAATRIKVSQDFARLRAVAEAAGDL